MCYQNHNICECVEELLKSCYDSNDKVERVIQASQFDRIAFKFIANKIIVQKKDNKNKSLLIT